MKYVPIRPTGEISQQIIENMCIKQNIFLKNIRRIWCHAPSQAFTNTWDDTGEFNLPGDNLRNEMLEEQDEKGEQLVHSVDSGPRDKFLVFVNQCNYDRAQQRLEEKIKRLENEVNKGINNEENRSRVHMPQRHLPSLTGTYVSVLK